MRCALEQMSPRRSSICGRLEGGAGAQANKCGLRARGRPGSAKSLQRQMCVVQEDQTRKGGAPRLREIAAQWRVRVPAIRRTTSIGAMTMTPKMFQNRTQEGGWRHRVSARILLFSLNIGTRHRCRASTMSMCESSERSSVLKRYAVLLRTCLAGVECAPPQNCLALLSPFTLYHPGVPSRVLHLLFTTPNLPCAVATGCHPDVRTSRRFALPDPRPRHAI